ncbi:hypothetical protein Tco_0874917 [Tanacetum coccineum]|uniref:Uncharacterized protein n=1 Tax=Tanacetum coccineum TaxID=301880 RepID=A0ABQ5BNB9_9ASTR
MTRIVTWRKQSQGKQIRPWGKAILTLVDRGRKTHDLDPLVSLVQELVTSSKTVNASGEEQVEDISPTTLEAAAILTKVQKIKSVDKGKRYKRRKSSKDLCTVLFRTKLEANVELKESVLGKDLTIEDYAKRMVELANQRRKHFAEERARAKRNKPMTQTQLKNYMSNFLKNQGTWKLTQLKKLNFEEVRAEFKKLVKQLVLNQQRRRLKKTKMISQPRRLERGGKLDSIGQGFHIDHDKDESKDSDEANEKDNSTSGTKIPINPVPVATKSPSIANYKIIKQGRKGVYQIVRENGTDMVYISFGAMLTDISRDDLTELYRIVMKKHGMNEPEDEFEKVLWEYLKNMFEEPLSTDSIWSLPGQQRIICWRYYDACRVHCLNLESADVYMLIERKYHLSAEVCKAMLDKKLQGGKPDEDFYKLLKMMEKQAGIRK